MKTIDFSRNRNKKIFLILFAFALFFLTVVSRSIDSLTNAQFWAEDGAVWYADAYNSENPLAPFLIPQAGYLQTVGRIGAVISLFFNLKTAPLAFNFMAMIIQILPPCFFLSERFNRVISCFYLRTLTGFIYLTLPVMYETQANLTNTEWHLALLMFLIIIAAPAEKIWWKIFDGIFLALAGLSGPFVFFAFPILLTFNRFKWRQMEFAKLLIVGTTFFLQLYCILFATGPAERSAAPLGANFYTFLTMVSGKIFVAGIFGLKVYDHLKFWDLWQCGLLPFGIFVTGLLFVGYAFRKAKIELRLLLFYSFAILAAALITPQVISTGPQWYAMLDSKTGNRYFLLPAFVWIISLAWVAVNVKNKLIRVFAGMLLLCLLCVGIPQNWIIEKYADFRFAQQLERFEKAPAGREFTFKINPPGWTMTLKKKP